MAEDRRSKILSHLKSARYRPQKPRTLARQLNLHEDDAYPAFREALRELMRQGRVVLGAGQTVMMPSRDQARDEFTGTYRHNRRGFGFVVPSDPTSHAALY